MNFYLTRIAPNKLKLDEQGLLYILVSIEFAPRDTETEFYTSTGLIVGAVGSTYQQTCKKKLANKTAADIATQPCPGSIAVENYFLLVVNLGINGNSTNDQMHQFCSTVLRQVYDARGAFRKVK